ncbi:MAG: chemotaxis protein CheR [Denitrovibrio sp.]|nr:MAG: chemotaxis protein CheR [Denitrovibrio sp.]
MNRTDDFNLPTHYVAVGASAGGLEAIESFFKHMPVNTDLAFIVIQHLSPDYKSLMVELLSKHTDMPVKRAEDGMLVEANNIYLIPPKKNLTIFHSKLILNDQPMQRGINLPIDIFMKSLAEDQGDKSIGIILSGTGSDGMRGIKPIKECGGMVMLQSEDTAKFDGMPKSVISTGLADFILAPEDMPETIQEFVKHPKMTKKNSSDDDEDLTKIFSLLRDATKVDFTYYKPSTVLRRIERRMTVNQFLTLHDYVRYMERSTREVNALYRELLIGVTNFFRDKEAFQFLEESAVTKIIKEKAKEQNEEIRVWIAACSTGEEAYSLAIVFLEKMEELGIKLKLKIFATDVDNNAIVYAGNGVYPESISADFDNVILNKYFTHKDDAFVISRAVRELVVFAQHNLIKDPPFTKIDLISCRNVLIYLQPVLQKKVLEMFSFALNTNGYLFLGTSETTGELSDCFDVLHAKWKVYASKYRRKMISSERDPIMIGGSPVRLTSTRMDGNTQALRHYENEKIYERLLDSVVADYASLVLVINEQLELLHSLGNTNAFIQLPSGKMTNDITKMVIKEITIPLATGIQKVIKSRDEVRYSSIQIDINGISKEFRMRIKHLPLKKGREPLIAIMIEETVKHTTESTGSSIVNFDVGEEAEQRIQDLEQELQLTKESLQATIEELETSNEELQATNEELLASNEELQSTNEELQSVNEELYTVNAEYQNKITELTELNNDLDNLLSSTQIGTLFLDEDLTIRKFTPLVINLFRIIESDIGRSLEDIRHSIVNIDVHEKVHECQSKQMPIEAEIETSSGKWYLMRLIPYHIAPNIYSGVTITFIGIDEIKKYQQDLFAAKELHLSTEIAARFGSWVLDLRTEELKWSNIEQVFGLEYMDFDNKYSTFLDIVHPDDKAGLLSAVDDAVKNDSEYEYEHRIITPNGEEKWIRESGKVVFSADGTPEKLLGVARDITKKYDLISDLAHTRSTLEGILHAAPVGIGLSVDRIIQFSNENMTAITGYTQNELDGLSFESLFVTKAECARVFKEGVDNILASSVATIHTIWLTKNKEKKNILITFESIDKDDASKGIVFTALDLHILSGVCNKMRETGHCALSIKK